MSAVVSFLWPKNEEALRRYLAIAPSTVYTPGALLELLSPQDRHSILSNAHERAKALTGQLEDAPWNGTASELRSGSVRLKALVGARVRSQLPDAMLLLAGLEAAHKREGIELLVLNEDVTCQSKAAAAWAKVRGVPTVVVSHSTIMGRLYTIHRENNADRIAVFSRRGAQAYLEMGILPSRIALTGNPAWDVYPGIRSKRDQIRAELAAKHGFDPGGHLVVFAPTWTAYLTAFCDPGAYDSSLRTVLRAVGALREERVRVHVTVKDRPMNRDKEAFCRSVAHEEGVADALTFTYDDTEKWIVAADAVISVDSNISIEALIAGVPAINLWTPMSWFNGPLFGAEDGVLEVAHEKLDIALARVLGDASLRAKLREDGQARLSEMAHGVGSAAGTVAQFMLASRKTPAARKFVWEQLSAPDDTAAQSADAAAPYYNSPRVEVLALIRTAPRCVLDVGCGGGATGLEIKRRYPNAVVHGVELSTAPAAIAKTRLDRVLNENVEKLDFESAGFAPESIDLVLFPDVLEHLYDPWHLLRRVKPFLAKDARILASIPNVRNLWLMTELLKGNWDYTSWGLLDVTHIRFFTKKSIVELFNQTGYHIESMAVNLDGRVPAIQIPENGRVDLSMEKFVLKNISADELTELRTVQFLVEARPI